ncbi:hypothetical protein ACWEQP_34835 [Streptomyces sp. NPDC004044]
MNRLERREHPTRASLLTLTAVFGAASALSILAPGIDPSLGTTAHRVEPSV